ncbi:hypothetical protein GCM10025868_44150 [Angustibacter aerolatus]|uniref:Glycoside hydrolase family 3 N-terminal domain-containing protein n=1 Tax=Angustibacter aerolatus TaxID=1162965 RepID=A0ABQ6JPH1_9ACTN|nr:hypothetical protein [Angustibacter aerolatus]GMA89165.1 hypothetical protein GCM10025868_44150 [Angustibacter aerolatus]
MRRAATRVVMAAFRGPDLPPWAERLLGEGLGSVCLFGSNVVDHEQVAALSARVHAAGDRVLVTSDEEGGDVTRLHMRLGSPAPGSAALGAADDLALTRAVHLDVGHEPGVGRRRPRPRAGRRREQQPAQPGDRRPQPRRRPRAWSRGTWPPPCRACRPPGSAPA